MTALATMTATASLDSVAVTVRLILMNVRRTRVRMMQFARTTSTRSLVNADLVSAEHTVKQTTTIAPLGIDFISYYVM